MYSTTTVLYCRCISHCSYFMSNNIYPRIWNIYKSHPTRPL